MPATGGPSKASVKDTANELGLHDTLRNGLRSLENEVKGGSIIQQRLERVRQGLLCIIEPSSGNNIFQWDETQDNLKMTLQRNLFGLHLPVRQMMERKIVAAVCTHVHNLWRSFISWPNRTHICLLLRKPNQTSILIFSWGVTRLWM